ncbi:glycosyltransferase, partial [uncultured Sutterella sp.]|uniref:glycosyltransferase n=1 Tax=uncultured Sutterella sp. TaxID=286133 RepID=UPI002636F3BF
STKLTVIMPIYNGEKEWIDISIKSILTQTYRKFHFLIINDGSNDEISNYLEHYTQDARIKIRHHHKNQGLTHTLNEGLNLSNTTWVARMDSDDWAHPDRFKIQMEYLESHPETTVLGTQATYLEDNKLLHPNLPLFYDQVAATLPFYCCICHPSTILNRKQIIAGNSYPDIKNAEDYGLWLNLLYDKKVIINLPNILIKYRKGIKRPNYHDQQKINTINIQKAFDQKIGMQNIRPEFIQDSTWDYIDLWYAEYYQLLIKHIPYIDRHSLTRLITYQKRVAAKKLYRKNQLPLFRYLRQKMIYLYYKNKPF